MGMLYTTQHKPVVIIQVVILGLVQIGYLVEVARTHPYYDHFHEYLEYFLVVINVITLGLVLAHINTPSEPAYLITALLQILALVACISTFIISWMQMHPDFSFKLWFVNLFSRKELAPSNDFILDDINVDKSISVKENYY